MSVFRKFIIISTQGTGPSTQLEQQLWQKIWPHKRQWWRRRVQALNDSPQAKHFVHFLGWVFGGGGSTHPTSSYVKWFFFTPKQTWTYVQLSSCWLDGIWMVHLILTASHPIRESPFCYCAKTAIHDGLPSNSLANFLQPNVFHLIYSSDLNSIESASSPMFLQPNLGMSQLINSLTKAFLTHFYSK